jgi:hypothetical protein
MKNVTFMLRLKEKQQNLAEFLGADYMERVDPVNRVSSQSCFKISAWAPPLNLLYE